MKDSKSETIRPAQASDHIFPECPFGQERLEAALDAFLKRPGWKDIYDNAPEGAKRRLEVSFLFTVEHDSWDRPELLDQHREWRKATEAAMTQEDLEYMIQVIDKPTARQHYEEMLGAMKGESHRGDDDAGFKLKSYDDFFGMLEKLGEFKSYDYDDETKRSIIEDFLPVLENTGDPLETHIEDILATAKLKEVRVYPKDETMYVRVEVQFLTETAEWSQPYQMVAAWDSMSQLKGYAFPVGKGRRTELPVELENPANEAQKEKRHLLKAERLCK